MRQSPNGEYIRNSFGHGNPHTMVSDDFLLTRFVASFGAADDLTTLGDVPPDLVTAERSPLGFPKWRPSAIQTERKAIEELYTTIPGPFPTLYEELVLGFRWLDIYLCDDLMLFANPPSPSLLGLRDRILSDTFLVGVLFPRFLVPFGRAGDSYDQVCFDLTQRSADGDCKIVRVEHEAVLCEGTIGDVWEVYESFRSLVNSFVPSERP